MKWTPQGRPGDASQEWTKDSASTGKNAKLSQGQRSIFRSGYRSSTCIRCIRLSHRLDVGSTNSRIHLATDVSQVDTSLSRYTAWNASGRRYRNNRIVGQSSNRQAQCLMHTSWPHRSLAISSSSSPYRQSPQTLLSCTSLHSQA